jgi:hypothetical protein
MKKWDRKVRTYLRRKRGAFDQPKDLLKDLKDLAWKYASPVREEESLKEEKNYPYSRKEIDGFFPCYRRDSLSEEGSVIEKIQKDPQPGARNGSDRSFPFTPFEGP